jgi:outer membrane protein TolC
MRGWRRSERRRGLAALAVATLLLGGGGTGASQAVAAEPTAAVGPTPRADAPPTDDSELDARPVGKLIDEYVREALQSNLSLKSESLEVERNISALDAARAQFLPIVALQARYSRSQGGREVDIPVGSIVNPIYSTLNQLLAAQGKSASFPSVPDQKILFQREREQDTRITVRQPLYVPAIPAAVRAQRAQLEAAQYNRVAVARRLKRDVSVAYLDWLKARRNVGIVQASLALLNENVRVNESLFRNGRVTQDQVLRARAEQLAVVQQLREAENAQSQARSFLNFLLNRSLDEPLEVAGIQEQLGHTAHDLADLRAAALDNRPELPQLDRTVKAAESQIQVASADLKPSLSLGIDAGIQDERYDFGHGSNFSMISLLLRWQFFDGGATKAQANSARAVARRAATQRDEIAQQIQLEVQQALDALNTATDSLQTAQARSEAARAAFRIASRKRDEGVINQVEFIDARSALTSAELNLNLTRFDVLSRQADLDYATAAGNLPLDMGK